MFEDLRSRVVLIRGAGTELGQSLALGFGEAGARVLVVDEDEAAAEETARIVNVLGGDASCVPADAAQAELGVLDVLVAPRAELDIVRDYLPLLSASDAGAAVLVDSGDVEMLARDAAASGVRVNSIAALPDGQTAPLGREIRPDDVVGVALFLASDASAFVTGETIRVDGGASLAAAQA